MKKGWEEKKLGDVCLLDKKKHDGSDLPYVGMEDISSGTGLFLGSVAPQQVKSSTFTFTQNHVLYGRLRPYLNKALIPDFTGHCSTEIFPLLPEEALKNFSNLVLVGTFVKEVLHDSAFLVCKRNWKVQNEEPYVATWSLGFWLQGARAGKRDGRSGSNLSAVLGSLSE